MADYGAVSVVGAGMPISELWITCGMAAARPASILVSAEYQKRLA